MNRMVDVSVTSSIEPTTSESVSNIVDGLSSTYLSVTVPKDKQLELVFTLNNNRREWFNRYSIQSSNSLPSADPREWQLLGSMDGSAWEQLDYRDNEVFTGRMERRSFELTGNTKAFSFVKLVVGRRGE